MDLKPRKNKLEKKQSTIFPRNQLTKNSVLDETTPNGAYPMSFYLIPYSEWFIINPCTDMFLLFGRY